ncbi:hypothetical protein HOU02_gp298 [Caulobacter phage CcrBL9]|uniref:Uncharacterized protein n=1 Tax=Caulobacter phage CcrBL9 TaxID=2283270 RepID=A0A385EF60_9CAUD|nr:hypothetical protein HOU02_gp298 [Caulobacter phage CcrBL9]AXQ69427.1 hypothetical protein CcrBL9_gp403 [Caulobacter phage CcrBL9]
MALRLRKTNPTRWNGNGFGRDAAEWELVDYPGWALYRSGGWWYAKNGDQVVHADYRDQLLKKLEPIVTASA